MKVYLLFTDVFTDMLIANSSLNDKEYDYQKWYMVLDGNI